MIEKLIAYIEGQGFSVRQMPQQGIFIRLLISKTLAEFERTVTCAWTFSDIYLKTTSYETVCLEADRHLFALHDAITQRDDAGNYIMTTDDIKKNVEQ